MQHSPHQWNKPAYGQRVQYAQTDNYKQLHKKGKPLVQSIIGTFLYYSRAIKTPMLVVLNDIDAQQSAPTEKTMREVDWLLDFLSHHPEAHLRYFAGSMQLADLDAAYLVAARAKSRYAGNFYIESHPNRYNEALHNAAIHTECRLLQNIVSFAAEAKCSGLFHNSQMALSICHTLAREKISK